jgi:oligopeptidase B
MKVLLLRLGAASVQVVLLACTTLKGAPLMAVPKKIPVQLEKFGDVRIDNYFWMKERDTEAVLSFLKEENAQTDSALSDSRGLTEKIFGEMRSRIKEEDDSVPIKDGNYYYKTRFKRGQEYPLYVRQAGSLKNPEQVIADVNQLAKGFAYFNMAQPEVSPNHNIAVLAADKVGRRFYDLSFRDLQSGEFLPDRISDTTGNVIWAADNQTIFYTKQDPETLRAFQVYRYRLGTKTPVLVFEEKDDTFDVNVWASKDNSVLFIGSSATVSNEVQVLDGGRPDDQWRILAPRERHHEFHIMYGGDRYFILTNWQAKNFRLMEAPLNSKGKSDWKEVIPHSPDIFLEGLDVYRHHVVLQARGHGLIRLQVFNRSKNTTGLVEFPEVAYTAEIQALPDYDSPVFRFNYSSLVRPASVFEYTFADGKSVLRKEKEVPGFDRLKYVTERIWAVAPDGVKVPISLVRQNKPKGTPQPLLLYGYGSYGLSSDAQFDSTVFSLVDRGFVYAIAHIRGGSEMGRGWYDDGKLLNKRNTFTDFIASAEHLVKQGYTIPEHLHINGGSAGGLLMGAVINMRPELFKGVVAEVPFVDVMTTMLDDTIPLTTSEYDEWGNPNEKIYYDYMRTYSPYDNVEAKAYPHMLVLTGYHDSQVQYWEPAKWVAKLRELKTDDHLLLFKTEMKAGHSGVSGRFEALKNIALSYAFFLKLEGVLN